MQSGDLGINKPFDRILKAFVDEAPLLFLRLLGVVPEGAEVEIQTLRPETAPAVVMPDYVAILRTAEGEPVIFHAEFQANYHEGVPRDMARYGGSLAWQRQMAVWSVLVMLRADRAPATIPEEGEYRIGRTRTTHPFQVVRLWEIDPAPVLATGNPKLLPWILLLKSTDDQVRQAAAILARQDDDEAVGRFFLLGGVRYDRNALEEMLGERKMSFTQAILDGSKVIQEMKEEAAAAAAEMAKSAEARKFLRLVLRKQLPELQSSQEIDSILNAEELESIAERVLEGETAESIRAAILTAAQPIAE